MHMKTKNTLITAAAMFATVGLYAAPQIYIETVLVDDKGNATDTRTTAQGGTPGLGAVSYNYYIGTYEVTAGQYTKFLNAMATDKSAASYITSLYNTSMASDPLGCGIVRTDNGNGTYSYTVANGNVPVNFVSVYDAMRFCNWVAFGTTETGVYNLNGVNSIVARDMTAMADGGVAIASLNEWYKAAFYNGSTNSYTTYAGSSTAPVAGVDANFAQAEPYSGIVDVGTYDHFASYYGTFDQNGNAWEWTETVASGSNVYLRGGGYTTMEANLRASHSVSNVATVENAAYGFRVSSLEPIPEPSTYAAIFGALALAVSAYRRRK
jgi:PEP-CTERM putative exosortase interaction domain